MHDSYYMKFTSETAWLQFKDDELWTSEPEPGEEIGYKEWVQGVGKKPFFFISKFLIFSTPKSVF